MPFVLCPKCRSKFSLLDKHLGRPAHCPDCGATFTPARRRPAALQPGDDEDGGDDPGQGRAAARRREKPARAPLIVALIIAAPFILCCGGALTLAVIGGLVGGRPTAPAGAAAPTAPAGAAASSTQPTGVTVELADARMENPSWHDMFEQLCTSDMPRLVIVLHVSNHSQTKKVDYECWQMHDRGVALRDEIGNTYAKIDFGYKGRLIFEDPENKLRLLQSEEAAIHPQEYLTDAVVFERPVKVAHKLTLTLPLRNVGERGTATVEFGLDKVRGLGPK